MFYIEIFFLMIYDELRKKKNICNTVNGGMTDTPLMTIEEQ